MKAARMGGRMSSVRIERENRGRRMKAVRTGGRMSSVRIERENCGRHMKAAWMGGRMSSVRIERENRWPRMKVVCTGEGRAAALLFPNRRKRLARDGVFRRQTGSCVP